MLIQFKLWLTAPLLILLVIIFFYSAVVAQTAATYYVDAANGNDNNTGLSQSMAWKTIAKVNASQFSPGDSILFKRGEIWREKLNVPSSGAPGNPITFGAYGTGNPPVITGADLITDWIDQGNNIWNSSLTTQANHVFFDGIRGKKENSTNNLDLENEWYWASDTIYVYSTTNPNNYSIETDNRGASISISGVNYINVSDIESSYAQYYGTHIRGGSHDIIVENIISHWNGMTGIQVYDETGLISNNITIQYCNTSYNYQIGIGVLEEHHNITIQKNEINHNANHENGNIFSGGMYVKAEKSNTGSDIRILENNIHHNGMGDMGNGIYSDTLGDRHIIRNNKVYNNYRHGIIVEYTDGALIAYNIVYGNNWGMSLWRSSKNNNFYNNVAYKNIIGLSISGSNPEPIGMINNRIKNNILFNNVFNELSAVNGGENDGIMGYNNIYKYNALGLNSSNFISWGANNYLSNYEDWELAYCGSVGCSNSIQEDPLLIDPENGDFHLQSASPAIDAGIDVGLIQDYDGIPVPQGSGTDIGAFEYNLLVMDTDGDGIPDGDGTNRCTGGEINNCDDNCVDTPNSDQTDSDTDGIGDVCDSCMDIDHDGYGNPGSSLCSNGGEMDCNDTDAAVYPAAADAVCDGVDNNCDGVTDDGYAATATSCGTGECAATGQTTCDNGIEGDTCEPGTPQAEICENGIDEDCDGLIDSNDTDCNLNFSIEGDGVYINGVRVIDRNGRWVGDPMGLQGAAGPAVTTSAVCVSAQSANSPQTGFNGYCSCNGTTVSKVTTAPGHDSHCTVTSDTGSCTAYGGSLGSVPTYTGQCCVCAP